MSFGLKSKVNNLDGEPNNSLKKNKNTNLILHVGDELSEILHAWSDANNRLLPV